jgi:uncharacterized membrane protein YfcA
MGVENLTEIWPLLIAGGLVVGFLVGMTGVGAGSLMTPFLITHVGIQPAIAVGTDLLFAAITKASAAAPHHSAQNVHWGIGRWLAAGSIPGALATLAVLHVVDPPTEDLSHLIKVALVWALFVSAAAIVVYPLLLRWLKPNGVGGNGASPVKRVPTVLLGIVLGSIVTLTSIGAGAIGMVVLTLLYPHLETRRLIGSDIVHAIPLTLISGVAHMGMGNTHMPLLGLLLVGSLPGIAIGARLTGRLPDWFLRGALAVILVFAARQLSLKI